MTTTLSPVEYVRSLSDADREAVFFDLVREVIREYEGEGVIPLQPPGGEPLGLLTPRSVSDRRMDELREVLKYEDKELTRRALANLDDTFDPQEVFDELNREDELANP